MTQKQTNLFHSLVVRFEPSCMCRGITSNQVTKVFFMIGLEHKASLRAIFSRRIFQLHCYIVIVRIQSDRFYVRIFEIVENTFVFGAHKLDSVHVDSKQSIVGMLPETFVYDREQSTAIQSKLFNAGQIPNLGF